MQKYNNINNEPMFYENKNQIETMIILCYTKTNFVDEYSISYEHFRKKLKLMEIMQL